MSSTRGVYLLGGSQTDFTRNLAAEGVDDAVFSLIREAAVGAVEDAGIDPGDIQRGHVGNHSSEVFTGQSHLGAMLPAVMDEWRQLPASRHEAACAKALELDVIAVGKIASMLARAVANTAPVLPMAAPAGSARFARDPAEYAGHGTGPATRRTTVASHGTTLASHGTASAKGGTGPAGGRAAQLTLIPGGAAGTTTEEQP